MKTPRAAWQFRWIEDFVIDGRYACRSFARNPAFTITAVLSLALGIGANVAIFNALYTVLFKPLPVSEPDSLAGLSIWSPGRPEGVDPPLGFVSQLRRAKVFDGLTILDADGLSFFYGDRAERIIGEVVSPDYFDFLGVKPILGESFSESVRGGHWAPEAVLSYSFWKRRFGGDPAVIGRTIHLNTYPFTIVGVSGPGFFGLSRGTDFELRIPILPDGQELKQIAEIGGGSGREVGVIGRLMPGTTLAQAEAAADSQLQEFLKSTTIDRLRDAGIRHAKLTPAGRGDNGMLEQFHTPLYVLFVLVGLVLLIACANVANMIMARATTRSREFAVRTSIGAGRLRLIRQLLVESLLLSLIAGALAVAVGNWAAALLIRFLPQGHMALVLDLRPDAQALLFTFALSVLASVLVGLAPAIESTRINLAATLKADSAGSTGGSSGARFRKMLVGLQVAFSVILLIAAGIFVRTMFDLRPTGYGAHPDRVLLVTMKPQQEIYTLAQKRVLVNEIVRRISNIPGVDAAAVAEYGPLGSRTSRDAIEAERGHSISAETDWTTPGFFETAGIRRIAGRDFATSDRPGSPRVVIVNQSMARFLFGEQNPIGRSLRFTDDRDALSYEIVGLVGDVHYYDLHAAPRPAAWFAFQDSGNPYMPTIHVRASDGMDTASVTAAVRRELDALDKGFPVFNIKTLADRMEDSLARERMVANVSGGIGLLALVLAAVGLYGILAYSVARRKREIGIRMALGSDTTSVVWMVAREALFLVTLGSLAGVLCSIAAYRLLAHQLAGVSAIDAPVIAGSTGVMLMVAALAVAGPSIRACRVDPLMALRQD